MIKLSKRVVSIITLAALSTTLLGTSITASAETNINKTLQISNIEENKEIINLLPELEEKVEAVSAKDYGLPNKTKDGTILHAFCWSFNTIKENMLDIAEAGYATVQTSPVNKCNGEGTPLKLDGGSGGGGMWWWHYQPTDWTIGNYQLGSREEFKEMCAEAEKYGVKIIVDVLPNHTTPEQGKVSQNFWDAVGGKGEMYHANGFNEIEKWQDRFECTTGQMGGLPDVNTENPKFQEYYMNFVNDVIELGGDGFRYDTAKHIGVPSDPRDSKSPQNDFWPIAVGRKEVNGVKLKDNGNLFIYGEVLQDQGLPYEEYASYMEMTASSYGGKLRGLVGGKNFEAGNIGNWEHATPDKIVTWVESHDTYFNHHESAFLSDWDIRMCWAVLAARAGGTPLFFSRPAGSNGSAGNYAGNNVIGPKGNDEFKHPEVAAVNKFRNAMVGQKEYLRNINGNQILQIDRGSKGTAIINLGGEATIDSPTTMADGTYKDQVSGNEFKVSGGKISGKLEGGKIACIYNATTTSNPDPKPEVPDTKPNPEVPDGENVAYIKLPAGWAGAYAYVYNDTPDAAVGALVLENAPWPGKAMTLVSGDLYKYEMPSGYDAPKLIFTDGQKTGTLKYPKDTDTEIDAGGLTVSGSMIYDGTTWGKYTEDKEPEVPEVPDEDKVEDIVLELTSDKKTVEKGESIKLTATGTGGTGKLSYKFDVGSETVRDFKTTDTFTWKSTEAGSFKIKVTAKDTEGNEKVKTITVKVTEPVAEEDKVEDKVEDIVLELTSDKKTVEKGESIKLKATGTGGTGKLSYKFDVGSETVRDFKTTATFTWKSTEAGSFKIKVTAKDTEGNEKVKTITVKVTEPVDEEDKDDDEDKVEDLEITEFTVSKVSPQDVGTNIKLTANASGGTGEYTYRFYSKKSGKTQAIQAFSSANNANWEPSTEGEYTIFVVVKDENGETATLEQDYTIKKVKDDNEDPNDTETSDNTKGMILFGMSILALLGIAGALRVKKNN